mgnify:CR=1 FL=1
MEKKYDANAFHTRKVNRITDEEMDRLNRKGVLEATNENIAKANDWVMVARESTRDLKYGRTMFSPSLDQLRRETMGEFYGSSIVD